MPGCVEEQTESNSTKDGWLRANVTPLFKKLNHGNAANYYPILFTSICCKLMKHMHILCHSIIKGFEPGTCHAKNEPPFLVPQSNIWTPG